MVSETAYRGTAPAFPKALADVPATKRVASRDDGLFVAMALGFAILCAGYGVECALEPNHPFRGLIGFGVTSLAFTACELLLLRPMRVTLAFDGEWIGLYRRGALANVITRAQLVPFQLRVARTIKHLMASTVGLLFVPLLACLAAYGATEPDERRQLATWAIAVGVALGTWTVGTIRARVLSRSFQLDANMQTDHAFSQKELKRFGL